MPAIQKIIEEYKNRNTTERLYLFLQYPGLRQVFDQIDDDEIDAELERLSISQQGRIAPQSLLSNCFSGLHYFFKSIFGSRLNAKNGR